MPSNLSLSQVSAVPKATSGSDNLILNKTNLGNRRSFDALAGDDQIALRGDGFSTSFDLFGGAGNDTIDFYWFTKPSGSIGIDGGQGNDTINAQAYESFDASSQLVDGLTLYGDDGNDICL